ncbi:MAG: Lhr family helicase, partial [Gammaproteobacteria bacterium]
KARRRRGRLERRGRSGRLPGSEGRWALIGRARWQTPSATEQRTAVAGQLIERYGVVSREALGREAVAGGFAAVYPVLRAMEDAGRVRRGYFVEGLGASQFALPGAEDRLRAVARSEAVTQVLAATDPANAWGAILPWPARAGEGARPARTAGARVILSGGRLLAFVNKSGQQVSTWLPAEEPDRTHAAGALAEGLVQLARGRKALLLTRIDGETQAPAPLHESLIAAGFEHGYRGYSFRGGDVVTLNA